MSSAIPKLPLIPPVLARLKWHVTPSTLGSSKASITTLWFEPKNYKTVSTDPISSAGKLTEEISMANKTKNIRSIVVTLKKIRVNLVPTYY